MTSIAIDRRDGLSSATAVKGPCRVATTANITLEGLQTVDGVSLVDGDRVLVKNQTNPDENGIYVVDSGTWARAKDFVSSRDVRRGTLVNVTTGATSLGLYEVTAVDPINVGDDSITFARFDPGGILAADVQFEPAGTGLSSTNVQDAIAELDEGKLSATAGKPLVILATGQSNLTYRPAYTWTPPPNLFIWNWDGRIDSVGTVGTAFEAPDGTEISAALSMAAQAAWENPATLVYVFQIGNGAISITHWLPATSAPDMYDCVKDNVEAALALIGVDTIDALQWWQGETDAYLPSSYLTNFATLMARFRGEDWFPDETPVVVHGVSSLAGTPFDEFNKYLVACVAADPEYLRYVHTAALPVAYWDAASPAYVHANADGYYAAGVMAWNTIRHGVGRASMQGISVDPFTGNVLIGEGVASTSKLRIKKNQAAITSLEIENTQNDPNGIAEITARSLGGALNLIAFGGAGAGAVVEYTGSVLQLLASHASGGIAFYTGGANLRLTIDSSGTPVFRPATTASSLLVNGDVAFELTSNSLITWKARGSDGVTRSGQIPLSNLALSYADAGADAVWGWDDSASTYANLSASDARAALALGTAATQNTGTSGANVPLLNGANTFSGNATFDGGTVLINGTSAFYAATLRNTNDTASVGPRMILDRLSASPAAADGIGMFVFNGRDSAGNATTYGALQCDILDPTDGSEDGVYYFQTALAGVTVPRMSIGGGLAMTGATGGDKGAGTINATAVYDDNTLLTCYPFDAYLDGDIDEAKWDALVPDRQIAEHRSYVDLTYEVKVAKQVAEPDESGRLVLRDVEQIESVPAFIAEPVYDDNGNIVATVETPLADEIVHPAQTIERRHEGMRKFKRRLGTKHDPLTLDGYAAHWKEKRHLTSLPNEQKFDPVEGLPTGEWVQRLVETVEIQAILIEELNQRLKAAGI